MTQANLLILVAVMLPPKALDIFGPVQEERTIQTAYGSVGPVALRASGEGPAVWVQPYSGLPGRTDPRATLLAAKQLGVQRVLNWDSVVAINPVLGRGQPLIVTDYIDFTRHQPATFFKQEGIGEISQTPAVCPQMTAALTQAIPLAPGAIYLGVDGPRRESAAEARLFRSWGADIVGQNLVPEISLAKELELCYAGLATVTAYGADQRAETRTGELRMGLELVIEALPIFVQALAEPPTCECANRLSMAKRRGLLADDWWTGDVLADE
jgi:5'-methylthioadenosine phosphorylase